MKIEKSNNPAAVGALVVVLALIVGRIFWMVLGHNRTAAAASRVSAASPLPGADHAPATNAMPAAAAAPAPQPVRVSAAVVPTTTRNPFFVVTQPARSVAQRARSVAHPDSPPSRHDAAHSLAMGGGAIPLTLLPPFPVRVLAPGLGASAKLASVQHSLDMPSREMGAKRQKEAGQKEALPLKLTAIVGGTEPWAVVQTANPEPVILHVGDSVDGMRVAAIHDQEVVFVRGGGFWTLPLQSAALCAAAGSVSVPSLPPASQPVVSVATPEVKTDELQHN